MSWTHLRDEAPVARKLHNCLICNERIEIGERHTARTGIDSADGPMTFRMHLECDELSSEWDADAWECHLPGDVSRPRKEIEG